MTAHYIGDGCTRTEWLIDSEERATLCIEYRPMLISDRAMLLRRVRALVPQDGSDLRSAEQLVLEEVCERLVSWSLRDAVGNAMVISVDALRAMETSILASLSILVLGLDEELQAKNVERERNLVQGVRLLHTNPRLAARDCVDCQQHVYDERSGHRAMHGNAPVVRPKGTGPPCRITQIGCPKGTPEEPRTLSTENVHVYRHYRECCATGNFPDDPIVKRHAALIQMVEQAEFQRSLLRRERSVSIRE